MRAKAKVSGRKGKTVPDVTAVDIGLFAVFVAVLVGPFFIKKIEENLEVFLFVAGIIATTIAWAWFHENGDFNIELVGEALMEPLVKGIVPAVLIAGLLFHYGRDRVEKGMRNILKKVSLKTIVFLMIVVLGLLSSVITAIIAALLLVEMVHVMPLTRKMRAELVIISCFSIGLGAALTPLGEPLSTIAITKLQGPPFHADFFFLFRQLGLYIVPGVVAFGVLGAIMVEGKVKLTIPSGVESTKERAERLEKLDKKTGKGSGKGKGSKSSKAMDRKDATLRVGKGKAAEEDEAKGKEAQEDEGNGEGDEGEGKAAGGKGSKGKGKKAAHDDKNGGEVEGKGKDVAEQEEDGDDPARCGDDKECGNILETCDAKKEKLPDVFMRAFKVYIFVMALIFLGGGMKVIIDKYFAQIPGMGLYWVNMMSAVLDNATLTAAEISANLSLAQIIGALMGLLIAGGMLIPGNIPNIIAANKLKITSKEWARLGMPLGFITMLIYFFIIYPPWTWFG